jgi:rRNA-processing protein FCF1
MFDTSVFNYIHEHDLYSHVESFFTQHKDITVYICDTQELEIASIKEPISKRHKIQKMMRNIPVQTVICSLGFVGSDKPSNRLVDSGFRVGKVKVADIDESKHKEIEELRRHKADATIIDTAITEEMDHLVTCDKDMETRLSDRLKKVRIYPKKHPELKIELIKEKDDLMNFLRELS